MSPPTPYLDRLDASPDRMPKALQWARYLGETFGTSGALNSLRYYERLGWISPHVLDLMTSYLQGLSLGETHNKKYDDPATLDQPLETLSGTPFGAHARSLLFISEIAGHDIEEHLMMARVAERRVDQRLGKEQPSASTPSQR